jgi:hypothetical protein
VIVSQREGNHPWTSPRPKKSRYGETAAYDDLRSHAAPGGRPALAARSAGFAMDKDGFKLIRIRRHDTDTKRRKRRSIQATEQPSVFRRCVKRVRNLCPAF